MRASLLAMLVVALALACGRAEPFAILHVDDVVALRRSGAVTVLDANKPDFREREGIVPGAVLLSSYDGYDVAKELPAAKDARLVFYCADSH
jgi:rhodanese-related sulfurtransferase